MGNKGCYVTITYLSKSTFLIHDAQNNLGIPFKTIKFATRGREIEFCEHSPFDFKHLQITGTF